MCLEFKILLGKNDHSGVRADIPDKNMLRADTNSLVSDELMKTVENFLESLLFKGHHSIRALCTSQDDIFLTKPLYEWFSV